MKRFHNLLAYVKGKPGEDIGLRRAAALARSNGARLTLLAVVDDDRRAHRHDKRRDHRLGCLSPEHLFEQRQSELDDYAAVLREGGVLAERVVAFGPPAEAILNQVARADHDLVLKAANPEDSSYRRFFGTTAVELMRSCPCPVWVVRGREPGPHRILAAIDPMDVGPVDRGERHELNQQVLQMSVTLAEMEGGELHVVHAWDALGLNTLGGRVVASDLADYVHSVRRAVARSVHSYLRDLGDLGLRLRKNRQIHLPRGAPWRRIPDIVLAIGASTVVMGTVARRGLHGYLVGNTAERVLPRVPASVIAVKGQTLSLTLRDRLLAATPTPGASDESRDATARVVS